MEEGTLRKEKLEANKRKSICYLCGVKDPNQTHYDSNTHHICLVCAVKLWELAQKRIELDVREQTVVVWAMDK